MAERGCKRGWQVETTASRRLSFRGWSARPSLREPFVEGVLNEPIKISFPILRLKSFRYNLQEKKTSENKADFPCSLQENEKNEKME